MRLRIAGTPADCDAMVAALGRVADLLEVSDPHPLHGDSTGVRIYVTARFDTGPTSGEGRCA